MHNKKKRFGISLRVELIEKYNEKRDTLSQEWTNFLQKHAIIPILIPNTLDDVKSYISDLGIDGLILSGGDNIGEFPERDKTEKQILDYAIDKRFPVLGVCRGMQIINEYFAGKVFANDNNSHVGKPHQIHIMDQKFSKLLGDDNMQVNSFHKDFSRHDYLKIKNTDLHGNKQIILFLPRVLLSAICLECANRKTRASGTKRLLCSTSGCTGVVY